MIFFEGMEKTIVNGFIDSVKAKCFDKLMISSTTKSREDIVIDVKDGVITSTKEGESAITCLIYEGFLEYKDDNEIIMTERYYNELFNKINKKEIDKDCSIITMTPKLRQRFCRDMGIPIKLFAEPYFSDRLKLYDKQYSTLSRYNSFLKVLEAFETEQDYFIAYNKLKDDAIEYLDSRERMKYFKQEEDMNKYQIKHQGFPKRDIFKETNNGHVFISIDMVKANFTSMKHYDKSIVGGKENYEDFVGMFTNHEHFIQSKYIRQVIFGNQNPRRQTTYEKYLMDKVMAELLHFTSKESIASFGNDEIIISISGLSKRKREKLIKKVALIIERQKRDGIALRKEIYELRKIPGTNGYVKKFLNSKDYEFKCLDNLELPFVLRAYQKEIIKPTDSMFLYENKLAKLLEMPKVEVA